MTATTMVDILEPLLIPDTVIRVSSTLDKSVAKKNLVDNNPETCWTSQQGLPQYILLEFPSPVIPKRLKITFQGGFVGTRCSVECPVASSSDLGEKPAWCSLARIYPQDINSRQTFDLEVADPALAEKGIRRLKLLFEASSDFFGRITIYDLQVEGMALGPRD